MIFRLLEIASIVTAAFSLFMFHQNYWRFRDSFNENGRYFDAENGIIYSSQSGIGWGLFALCALSIGLMIFLRGRMRNHD